MGIINIVLESSLLKRWTMMDNASLHLCTMQNDVLKLADGALQTSVR